MYYSRNVIKLCDISEINISECKWNKITRERERERTFFIIYHKNSLFLKLSIVW